MLIILFYSQSIIFKISMDKNKNDGRVKILMLGESNVGKTSLLLKFTENKFSNDFITTLGVEYK